MPSSGGRKVPLAMSTASTTSAAAVKFRVRLSKVSSRKAVAFSSRVSNAATTSMSENATRPMVLPMSMLSYTFFPTTMIRSMATPDGFAVHDDGPGFPRVWPSTPSSGSPAATWPGPV